MGLEVLACGGFGRGEVFGVPEDGRGGLSAACLHETGHVDLVGILQALEAHNWAAGQTLAQQRSRLTDHT